jgi:predicted ATPase
VLVTSRAPLRIRGEVEVAVDPLALPAAHRAAEVYDAPAGRLLLERAAAVNPGWGRADADADAVATICERLAGIPLALELAAARARLLEPAALLARLDSALLEGPRDLPARQRTMRATLDWSYGLLGPDEQALLRLLAAFVGGFRLDDLEAVASRAGLPAAERVLPLLESLVEQSLVVADGGRFRLLEPVAQYARVRLDEAGEADAATRAHADHFLTLAEEIAPHYRDGDQVAALTRVDEEHPNLTAAAERTLAAGDPVTPARLAWALWMYWWLRGHLTHGRRLAEAVLAHDLPDGVRARAELAAATMTFALDDLPAARGWWTAASADAGDDEEAKGNAVAGLGLADLAVGALDDAEARFSEALPHAERGGPGGEWTWGLIHVWLGTVALLRGDADEAVDRVETGLASARRRGDRLSAYIALYNLSQVELARGRHDAARRHLEEGVRLSRETGDLANLAYLLDALAVLEALEGAHARVPLLLGAAQGIREAIGSHGYGYYRPDPVAMANAAEEARQHLGTDRYDDALDTGRSLTPERAAALAMGERVPAH